MLSKAQHLDYDMLEELKDIMDDEFLDLLRAFLSDSKMRINSLRSAYADNRQDNISAIAHSFKGSSGNIGAHALSELCKELEKFAKEGLTADVSELIDGLEKEFLSVSAELLDVVSAHE
jgi:HPt (histidine-containing phosphotransfer) domain-containing protein